MATVTGITEEKAQAIQNASVTSGYVSGTHLILETFGGEEIDAGQIVPTPISAWPVGSIFMNTTSVNPNTLLGAGTWVRWGQGRMPVSLDVTQTEFDGSEEIGGEKTHTLTAAEMPIHTHIQNAHNHSLGTRDSSSLGTNNPASGSVAGATASVNTGSTVAVNQNSGGDGAHNNLPPYIVVYMWKRTA